MDDIWPDHPLVQEPDAAWPNHPLVSPDPQYGVGQAIPRAADEQAASNLSQPAQLHTMRLPAMVGSNILGGALAGAGAIGDIADYGQGLVTKYLHDPLYKAITGNAPPPPDPSLWTSGPHPLSSTSLLGAGRAIGAVDNPALTPQDQGEQYTAASAQGAGGALPYMWMGGISPLRSFIAGAAGGGAGEWGAQTFPEHPVLARTIGNLGVGMAVGGAPRAAPTDTQEAFTRLGINNPLPGDIAGPGFRQKATARAADMPGGGMVAARQRSVIDGWGNAVDDVAGNIAGRLGVPETAQQAGGAIQAAATNWLGRFNNYSRQLWGDVDMHIPPATPMPITNYQHALDSVTTTMPAGPRQAQVVQSDFIRNLSDGLRGDLQAGPMDWQTMSGLRTRIGAMISDPQLIGGPDVTELRRIYRGISADMEAAAHGASPQAAQAFRNASNFTRTGHDYIDSTLSNLVGRRGAVGPGGIIPEDAYRNAMADARLGGTMLENIRNGMPDAADQLGAYELRARAQATPGQQGVPGQGQTISPTTFVTRTNPGNLSREARDALWPNVQNQLNDLRTTAGAMRETERSVNKSGTGPYLATKEVLDAIRNAALGAAGGYGVAGPFGASIGAISAAVAPWLPGLLGSGIALRGIRNYGGLLQYPERTYGGATAAPSQQP